jgi:hypothetical protein
METASTPPNVAGERVKYDFEKALELGGSIALLVRCEKLFKGRI